jgi:glycosyltransferase involved in cell wall biosynthesis
VVVAHAIDSLHTSQVVSSAGFLVTGWAYWERSPVSSIEVFLDGEPLGRAGLGRPRPDVSMALGEPDAGLSGFEFHLEIPLRSRRAGNAALRIAVTLLDGSVEHLPEVLLEFERVPERAPVQGRAAITRPKTGRRRPWDRPKPTPVDGAIRVCWMARGLDHGGSQLRMAEVIAQLSGHGEFTSTVLTPHDGPLRADLERSGALVRLIDPVHFDDSAAYEQAIAAISGHIEGACDVVLGPTVTSFPAIDAANRLGIPSVLRIGEAEPLRVVLRWLGRVLESEVEAHARAAIAGASVVWSNSHAAVRTYREQGYEGRFLVLGSGFDTAAAGAHMAAMDRAQCRARLGVAGHERVLLCPATLWPIKGQALLARAMLLLRDRHPDLRCVLVGQADPPYAEAIERFLTHHDLADVVRIVPFCNDLRPWWRAADAAVCPSESEALPAAVVEAMAHGLPVLGARVGDMTALVEPGVTGWLCDPADLRSLTDAMATIATAPQDRLRAMGAAAARKAAREHDRTASLERTVELLRAAANGEVPRWSPSRRFRPGARAQAYGGAAR